MQGKTCGNMTMVEETDDKLEEATREFGSKRYGSKRNPDRMQEEMGEDRTRFDYDASVAFAPVSRPSEQGK